MIPLAVALDPTLVTMIVGVILGGGGLTAYAVARKAGPEADQIVAATLIEVNKHLREELALRDKEIEHLRDEVTRLRERLREVQDDLSRVETELTRVSQRTATQP